jgi:hypothetical protein
MPRGSKLAVALVHPYILVPHLTFSPYLLPYVWTKKKRGTKRGESKKKRTEKENRKRYQDLEGAALPASLSRGAGLDSFHHYTEPPTKTREAWVYVGRGARVLSGAGGPCIPRACERICGVLLTFYEWGFSVLLHQFLRLLLWYYGLELHHQTPSGVLHIAAYVTLCEANIVIDPDLDLWKYFFHVPLLQDPEAELTTFGGTVIHVKLGHEVHPYLEIPILGR